MPEGTPYQRSTELEEHLQPHAASTWAMLLQTQGHYITEKDIKLDEASALISCMSPPLGANEKVLP